MLRWMIEKRREERGQVDYKLATRTTTKKNYERDMWVIIVNSRL